MMSYISSTYIIINMQFLVNKLKFGVVTDSVGAGAYSPFNSVQR